jgi:hypothetical protein
MITEKVTKMQDPGVYVNVVLNQHQAVQASGNYNIA